MKNNIYFQITFGEKSFFWKFQDRNNFNPVILYQIFILHANNLKNVLKTIFFVMKKLVEIVWMGKSVCMG